MASAQCEVRPLESKTMTEIAAVAPPEKSGWWQSHLKAALIATFVFLFGIGLGAASGGSTKTNTVAGPTVNHVVTHVVNHVKYRTLVTTQTNVVTQAAAPPPTAASGVSDKNFSVQDLQIQDDGLGDIGGIARLTNTASKSLTGTFTFTFFQGGQVIGTAQGSADSVASGQTVTVQLVSQSPMVSGQYRYQFQVDAEY